MKRQTPTTRSAVRLAVAVAAAGIALPVVTTGATDTLAGTSILRHVVVNSSTHTLAGTSILRHAVLHPNGTSILR